MFCEECGTELDPGARFCENCGTPVPQEEKHISFENGVILTNLNKLASQLGTTQDSINNLLSEYIDFCKQRGISYSLLNLDNQNSITVDKVISTLKARSLSEKIKYVFILGNEEIIPVIEYHNESGDQDEKVPSDLPYSILENTSPWNGINYSFDKMLRTGRLVSYSGESFEKFSAYFKKVMHYQNSFPGIKPYSLSAKVWKNETDFEYKKIKESYLKDCDSSPEITVSTVENFIPNDTNLLMFNLHGSNQTKFWYGQDGQEFPEAFSPQNINALTGPFVIGVEACYGANYSGGFTEDNSILVKAMQSGCISLLGSSRIAYGSSEPEGNNADFMIGEYLKQIKNGVSAGDAHIAGIQRVVCDSKNFSDVEIKTIAEFNLFGDPSISTGLFAKEQTVSATQSSSSSTSSSTKSFNTGFPLLNVNMPDIRRAVRLSLAKVDSKIETAINTYVYEKYAFMKGSIPKTYRVEGKDLFQSIYTTQGAKGGIINQTVRIYYDRNGAIKKEMESK